MLLQKALDIIMTEPHYATDQVARQITALDHPIDGHFVDLKQIGKLADGVELTRTYMLDFLVGILLPHPRLPRAGFIRTYNWA